VEAEIEGGRAYCSKFICHEESLSAYAGAPWLRNRGLVLIDMLSLSHTNHEDMYFKRK
jgi:hypothetical protein